MLGRQDRRSPRRALRSLAVSAEAVERYSASQIQAALEMEREEEVPAQLVDASAHDAAIAALTAELQQCREALDGFVQWASKKCPCENEQPNPCPLCGASVESLEPCKAADSTLPRHLLDAARAALKERT